VTRSALLIVKIGGSLFDWPGLPTRLEAFLDARRATYPDERTILIAGGGPIAELVRDLDRAHGLGDPTAHHLALRALDFTAALLAALVPRSSLVDRFEALAATWDTGRIPVLVPRPILDEIERSGGDPLPESWAVTSDTISARIAAFLGAESLVLLKSAPLPHGATREDAARLEWVDPIFPEATRIIPWVGYLNLRDPAGRLETL
jgi:aspartokinase-like uncharacterized kinase